MDDDEVAGAAMHARTMVSKPVQAMNPSALVATETLPKPKNKAPGAKIRPNAESFMAWIQTGLGTGELSYNE
ncbi:hypothetical protein RZS08_51035, partial [Arthrospira platensis SPKY1]|nr:hypothetical protein [Arthrospira platensis SPKY1]